MAVPDRLLVHDLVDVAPASTADTAYGTTWTYGTAATRTGFRGWLEQTARSETVAERREIVEQRWTLITNYIGLDATHRVEWGGHPAGGTLVFSVDGPPEPAHTPRGRHHVEVTLRKVEG